MTSSRTRLCGLLAVVSSLAAGCADLSRGKAGPDAGDGGMAADSGGDGPATDGAASFATDVEGVLSTCRRCHATGEEAGDTALLLTGVAASDYTVVLPFVDTGTPSSSVLLAKMSGNGHGGGTLYAAGSPQYQTVLLWIQEGAPR